MVSILSYTLKICVEYVVSNIFAKQISALKIN